MNNKDLLKFGKCLLIGIIVAIGGTFFSDLYGNIFNGSGDYRLSAIFGIGLYLCIVIVTCTGLILNRLDKDKTNDKDDELFACKHGKSGYDRYRVYKTVTRKNCSNCGYSSTSKETETHKFYKCEGK